MRRAGAARGADRRRRRCRNSAQSVAATSHSQDLAPSRGPRGASRSGPSPTHSLFSAPPARTTRGPAALRSSPLTRLLRPAPPARHPGSAGCRAQAPAPPTSAQPAFTPVLQPPSAVQPPSPHAGWAARRWVARVPARQRIIVTCGLVHRKGRSRLSRRHFAARATPGYSAGLGDQPGGAAQPGTAPRP